MFSLVTSGFCLFASEIQVSNTVFWILLWVLTALKLVITAINDAMTQFLFGFNPFLKRARHQTDARLTEINRRVPFTLKGTESFPRSHVMLPGYYNLKVCF